MSRSLTAKLAGALAAAPIGLAGWYHHVKPQPEVVISKEGGKVIAHLVDKNGRPMVLHRLLIHHVNGDYLYGNTHFNKERGCDYASGHVKYQTEKVNPWHVSSNPDWDAPLVECDVKSAAHEDLKRVSFEMTVSSDTFPFNHFPAAWTATVHEPIFVA